MVEQMNPFKQMIEALKAFTYTDTFYKLRKQSVGSRFVVALLTSVIACLFTFIVGGFKTANSRVWSEIIGAMPEFTYVNGEMVFENKYDQPVMNVSSVYTVVDTDVDTWAFPQYDSSVKGTDITNKVASIVTNPEVEDIVFISRHNLIMLRGIGTRVTYQESKWSELFGVLNIQSLSKSQIKSGYKGTIMKGALILCLFMIPYRFGQLFFLALLLTLIALIINGIHKSNEDFPTLYWITFYIQSSLMMIIALLRVFVTVRSSVATIVCVLYYIVTMNNVLKNGPPMESSFGGNIGTGGAVSSFGVIQDDFDMYAGQKEEVPDFAPKSEDFYYQTEKEDYYQPEQEERTESTGGTSGLSLKRDD